MNTNELMSGVFSPVLTPFDKELKPDADNWQEHGAGDRQQALDRVRSVFQGYVMIPAMKAAVAHYSSTAEWRRVRPPLEALTDEQTSDLCKALDEIGFSMEGL